MQNKHALRSLGRCAWLLWVPSDEALNESFLLPTRVPKFGNILPQFCPRVCLLGASPFTQGQERYWMSVLFPGATKGTQVCELFFRARVRNVIWATSSGGE